MRHVIRHRPESRYLASCQRVLARIDQYLRLTNPEVEREKIERALEVMFGREPTAWIVNPPSETADAAIL